MLQRKEVIENMMLDMQLMYGTEFSKWLPDKMLIQMTVEKMDKELLANIPAEVIEQFRREMTIYFPIFMPRAGQIQSKCKNILAEKRGIPDASQSLKNGFCGYFAHPEIEKAWHKVRSEMGQQAFHGGKEEDVLEKFKISYDEAIMRITDFSEIKKIGSN